MLIDLERTIWAGCGAGSVRVEIHERRDLMRTCITSSRWSG